MFQPVIFREYDIRGIYEEQFDDEFAFHLGLAFTIYVQKKLNKKNVNLIVGRDARKSGPAIQKCIMDGMQAGGATVTDLGMITSPLCYFGTFTMANVDGAIQVTGSHNPPDYNGFKLSLQNQSIFGAAIQNLLLETQAVAQTAVQTFPAAPIHDLRPAYIERYKQEFQTLKSFPLVLDCGNGAAGCVVRTLFESVGLKPEILFEKPDGDFPNHHPDPTVEENLVALRQKVLETRAKVGIGFDGDADRIGVVDHRGHMVYGDELMVIFSRAVLAKNPGAKIVGDVKCSDRLYHDIQAHGGQAILWKTGHALIKQKIKDEHAAFGGEMSGHIFFADRNYGFDDALYAGLRLCEIIAQTGKTIPELLEGLPAAFNTPEIRIDTTEQKKVRIVQKIKSAFATETREKFEVNELDGIRVSFQDGWALARASNTQPVIVVRFESNTEAGLKRIRNYFEPIVESELADS